MFSNVLAFTDEQSKEFHTMRHSLSYVAQERLLDPVEFAEFAAGQLDRYGIVEISGEPTVSTWHVDKLCQDYIEAGGKCIDNGANPTP